MILERARWHTLKSPLEYFFPPLPFAQLPYPIGPKAGLQGCGRCAGSFPDVEVRGVPAPIQSLQCTA